MKNMNIDNIKNIIKNILIFLAYFIYEYLIIILLKYLGFNFYEMGITKRIIILVGSNICFISLLLFIYRKELIKDIKDFKENYKDYIPKYIIYYLGGVLLMGIINIILMHFTGNQTSGNEETIRLYIEKYPLYMLFSTVLYAPFVEEIIFRKSIRNVFKNKYLFVVASGLIFGVAHISNFSSVTEWLFGIPYMIMGMDFAYIYYKSDNIFTTMSYHLLHNAILLMLQFIK